MFLILSFLSAVIETAYISAMVMHKDPLFIVLLAPLAYQIGNLFPHPFCLSKRIIKIITVIAIGICITILSGQTFALYCLSYDMITGLSCLAVMLISVGLQSVRSIMKTDGNRMIKRISRIIGFFVGILGGGFAIYFLFATAIAVLIALLSTMENNKNETKQKFISVDKVMSQAGFSYVMIAHQLHYFSYAMVFLAYMLMNMLVPVAATVFCLSWITYTMVEPIIAKRVDTTKAFYAGHTFLSCILILIALCINQRIVCSVLIIVAGIGGGVVYTIKELAKKYNSYDKDSMESSEAIGHIAGLVIAIVLSYLFYEYMPIVAGIFASGCAITAVIMMKVSTKNLLSKGDCEYES